MDLQSENAGLFLQSMFPMSTEAMLVVVMFVCLFGCVVALLISVYPRLPKVVFSQMLFLGACFALYVAALIVPAIVLSRSFPPRDALWSIAALFSSWAGVGIGISGILWEEFKNRDLPLLAPEKIVRRPDGSFRHPDLPPQRGRSDVMVLADIGFRGVWVFLYDDRESIPNTVRSDSDSISEWVKAWNPAPPFGLHDETGRPLNPLLWRLVLIEPYDGSNEPAALFAYPEAGFKNHQGDQPC